MIWENGIKTCIISYKKRIASPGSMQDTGSLGLELLRMRVEAFPRIQVPLHITLGKAKKSRIKDMRTLSKALFPLIMRT